MNKGARKPGGCRRRSACRTLTRRSLNRPEKITILIVGEGQETEPNYFRELKRDRLDRSRFTVTVKKGHGRSAKAVVEEALDHKRQAAMRGEDYDQVWCVTDVEQSGNRRVLREAVTLSKKEQILLCLSNPSFEVWLQAHFVRTCKRYDDADAVIADLNKYWRKHFQQEYGKNDERIYQRVESRTATAIKNARLVRETDHDSRICTSDCNSSTDVYKLVEHLLS